MLLRDFDRRRGTGGGLACEGEAARDGTIEDARDEATMASARAFNVIPVRMSRGGRGSLFVCSWTTILGG